MSTPVPGLDFAVVDAHHHFWDLERNYHPWLCDEPMIPFRYGDIEKGKRLEQNIILQAGDIVIVP